eukprot:6241592-Prorocentrum_lima.AAC.1
MCGRRRAVGVEHLATTISSSRNQNTRSKSVIGSIPPKAGRISAARSKRAAIYGGRPLPGGT